MNTKALVLLSGGQDSATCLAVAMKEFSGQVEAVGFYYGQRHRVELEQAKIIAQLANIHFQTVDLSFISTLSHNALTSPSIPIEERENEPPSTCVDGRNLFFISTAAVIAKQRGIRTLYTGVCQTDYSGYPDCRDDFIKSLNATLNLSMEYKFDIRTPLMWLTKAETVLLMKELNRLEWYKETHTCYEGSRPACGVCPACKLRKNGFFEAGVQDPLLYK